MSMEGRIYPRGDCPVCSKPFQLINDDMICPDHLTRPKRVYIQIKHKGIYSDPKGNPFYSYEQAKRYLDRMRTEIDEKKFDFTDYIAQHLKPLRFKNYSEAWLEKKEIEVLTGKKTPSYLKSLKAHIRRNQQPFFIDTDIREIGTKQIYEFYLTINQAPHYVSNILDTLENMLGDAFDWGDIKIMPKFPVVEIPEPDRKTVDIETQDKAIESISDQMDRTFVLLTARLMLRPCEPRALWWEDIDFKHHWVFIKRHFSLNEIRLTTKPKKIRRLPMDIDVENSLLALPRYIGSPFVFWKKKGHPFSESWARKVCKKVTRAMGLEISLYELTKHSSATEAADRVGIDATQEFLGSGSRKIVQKYIQANPDRLRKVLRK